MTLAGGCGHDVITKSATSFVFGSYAAVKQMAIVVVVMLAMQVAKGMRSSVYLRGGEAGE